MTTSVGEAGERLNWVLSELERLLGHSFKAASLPGMVIAGGAIGNLLLSRDLGLSLLINDVDVFCEGECALDDDGKGHEGDYFNAFSSDSTPSLRIKKASQEGKINWIETNSLGIDAISYARTVIGSFDFNCVEACVVRREDGSWALIESEAFKKAIETREVAITRLTSPFRTLVRWHKKRSELKGLYFRAADQERIFQALAYGPRQVTSAKTIEKYLRFAAKSSRGLLGFRPVKGKPALFLVEPNMEKAISFTHKERLAFGKVYAMILEAADARLTLGNAALARYKELAGYPSLLRAGLKMGIAAQVRRQSPKADLLRAERLLARFPAFAARAHEPDGPGLLSLVERLSAIEAFASRRHELIDPVLRSAFLGRVERQLSEGLGLSAVKTILAKALIETQAGAKPLNADLPAGALEPGGPIFELRTAIALMNEGAEMHHCVGGYCADVGRGASRIFSIKSEGDRSTLEIDVRGGLGAAFIVQHRAKFNRMTSWQHRKVAMELVRRIRERGSSKALSRRTLASSPFSEASLKW